MASPQLVAHVPIPLDKLRQALERCAQEGFHGRVSIEIRISPDVVVDRIQTFKASSKAPEKSWSAKDRGALLEQGVSRIREELAEMKDVDSVTITGHFNDGRMLQMDVQEVQK